MILRTLTLQGWRCFANPVSIGPLTETINVIHAPNGTGKSTLFQAMTRGLFDSHKVTGETIDKVRCWGRDLAPGVTVEFSQKGIEYRVTKKFLADREARLLRHEKGCWVSLAESDAATEQLRAMFMSDVPTRGATDVKHWGLGQILWAGQGKLPLPNPSGPVIDAIKHCLGVQAAGQEMSAVESRIHDAYSEYFSPGGEYRKGKQAPEITRLQARLAQAVADKQKLQTEFQEFDEASRQVEDYRARFAQASRNLAELTSRLERERINAKAYDRAIATRDTCEANVKASFAEYSGLKSRVDAIVKARGSRDSLLTELAELERDVGVMANEVTSAQMRLDNAKTEQRAVGQRQNNVTALEEELDAARRFVEAANIADRVGKLICAAEQIQEKLDKLNKQLAEKVFPDKKTLNAIRKVVDRCRESCMRLDASLIRLEITPQATSGINILAAENTGPIQLKAAETVVIAGSPEVVVEIQGVGRIRAHGPASSADALRKEIAEAEAEIQKLTRAFGTREIRDLEALQEEAARIQKELDAESAKREGVLTGASIVDLRQQLARESLVRASILKSRESWEKSTPDVETLKRAVNDAKRIQDLSVKEAQDAVEYAQHALRQSTQRVADRDALIKAGQSAVSQVATQLRDLESDGHDDAVRQNELRRLALEYHACTEAVGKALADMKEFPQDPNLDVKTLEAQVNHSRTQAENARDLEKSARGRLSLMAEAGTYSKLSDTCNQIESLEAAIAGDLLRLSAIKLLHELLEQRHRAIAAAITKPIEDKATRLLQRICGPRLGSVCLTDTFLPDGMAGASVSRKVLVEELSGGECEQVHLAVRLALADQLATGERELLVLDDVLTATDAARLARIQTILGDFSQRFQVVILTCHPERYGGLAAANFIDLEARLRVIATAG